MYQISRRRIDWIKYRKTVKMDKHIFFNKQNSRNCINQQKTMVSQTLFSLYLHNQWTNFHKLSCTRKPKMKAIHTFMGCTKATTNNWDIRSSVTVKYLFANISWTARQIYTIKLVLESAHQTVSNDIWYIS